MYIISNKVTPIFIQTKLIDKMSQFAELSNHHNGIVCRTFASNVEGLVFESRQQQTDFV